MNDKERKMAILEGAPKWVLGINSIDEILYGFDYIGHNPMICVNDKLFDVNGEVDIKYMSYCISRDLHPYLRNNLSNRVKSVIDTIKLLCF